MHRLKSVITIMMASMMPFACTTTSTNGPTPEISKESVAPGTSVSRAGQPMPLAKGTIAVDGRLPDEMLTDQDWQAFNFSADGRVKVVSIVPSIDTRVCEVQTHILSESKSLNPKVERISLSRDLPTAQKRFAAESMLTNIRYLSDYKTGAFGRSTGLMVEEMGLLARAVLVVDGEGKVRYLQVVPDVTKLPDMERAFAEANKLVK